MSTEKAIATHVAHAGYDEHIFMGQQVFAELLEKADLNRLINLAVVGPDLDATQLDMLSRVSVILTVADPRIWPLKVTRLAASYGNGLAGMGGAMLVMDNLFASTWHICRQVAEQLVALKTELEKDQRSINKIDDSELFARINSSVSQSINKGNLILGFGVPARAQDERTAVLKQQVEQQAMHKNQHWRLFLALEQSVRQTLNLPANIATAWSALALDLGFLPNQIGPLSIGLGVHVFLANAVEAQNQQEPRMQHLGLENIDYQGPLPRQSPRSQQRASEKNLNR